jgi:hypothetical protein
MTDPGVDTHALARKDILAATLPVGLSAMISQNGVWD